jgi:hypothetical protein
MPSLAPSSTLPVQGRERALRILAHSIVRELDSSGYKLCDIATLASEIIDLACEMSRSRREAPHGPA